MNIVNVDSFKETVYITSRDIAEVTGKRHDHIIRDIENALKKDAPKFGETYLDSFNRSQKQYKLPKNIALGIVSGYSFDLRMKIINRLEELENKPMTIEDLLKQNVKVIGDLQNKVITLSQKIENDKPKVNFANAITGTTSNIDFETFAKALFDAEGLKFGRNNLMKWFRDNGYLTSKNKPYQSMLDRGLMSLKEGSYVNQSTQELVTYTQPRLTGKGQMYFTNKLLDEVAK